jgi:alkanesulfonate monooxygenase SsuD/methylene tetrahydromethanopterin reductase-like flavin-dependent oxidoreductase (luciferase family)
MEALAIYRREFKPSPHLDKPYVMVGIPALAADTDERAEFIATSMYQRFLGMVRNKRAPLPPPVEDIDKIWSPGERYAVAERMALMVVGGPQRVAQNLKKIVEMTGADELIIASDAFERKDRLRSYEILAEAARQ